jgi:hypothetical protein
VEVERLVKGKYICIYMCVCVCMCGCEKRRRVVVCQR